MNFFRMALACLIATALFASTGCSIDLTSGELDVSDDDDSAAEVECQFLERYFADEDGDVCLSWWERDDDETDRWVSLNFCGYNEQGYQVHQTEWPDGTVTNGPPPYPYIPESLLCPDEDPEGDDDDATDDEEDEVPENEAGCDDGEDNDEDGDVDCDDSDCADAEVCQEDEPVDDGLDLAANELYIEWTSTGSYAALELVCGLQGTQPVSLGVESIDIDANGVNDLSSVNSIAGSLFSTYVGGDYRCTVFIYPNPLDYFIGWHAASNWSCTGNASLGMTMNGQFSHWWSTDAIVQSSQYVNNWSDGCENSVTVTGS